MRQRGTTASLVAVFSACYTAITYSGLQIESVVYGTVHAFNGKVHLRKETCFKVASFSCPELNCLQNQNGLPCADVLACRLLVRFIH
jgi:hypothetical protein